MSVEDLIIKENEYRYFVLENGNFILEMSWEYFLGCGNYEFD